MSGMESEPILGIDLGTSSCCIAVCIDGKVDVIPNEFGSRTTPSYVNFTENGRTYGETARNQIGRIPSNRLFDIKRLIGQRADSIHLQRNAVVWPFQLSSAQGKPMVNITSQETTTRLVIVSSAQGKPMVNITSQETTSSYCPEEILAMQLCHLRDRAENYLGRTVRKAVIGIPCSYTTRQREAIRDAGRIAGLTVLRLHFDPSLSALAFAYKNKDLKTYRMMVVDVGGGHCNIGVVSANNGVVQVEFLTGDSTVSGQDFSIRMLNHILQDLSGKHKVNLMRESRAISRILVACGNVKRVLSTSQKYILQVDALPGDVDLQMTLTREQFEKSNVDLFKVVISNLSRALREANVNKSEIDEVVLVGGSTRIPMLQSMIQEFFSGRTPNKQLNPDEAVAEGAAVLGAILNGDQSELIKGLLLLDVLPYSLGIEMVGNSMATIISSNKFFPVRVHEEFKAAHNGQGGFLVQLYEGESGVASENLKLAQLLLLDTTRPSDVIDLDKCQLCQYDERKQSSIQVTLEVSEDMTVSMYAIDNQSKKHGTVQVLGLSTEEITHMIEKQENLRSYEIIHLKASQVRNQLENAAFMLQGQAEILSQASSDVLTWLEANQKCDHKSLEEKRAKLQEKCNSVINTLVPLTAPSTPLPSPAGSYFKVGTQIPVQNR